MKDSQPNMEIDAVIRAAMEMTDVPAPELNQKLKTALYQQESCFAKATCCAQSIPMVFANGFEFDHVFFAGCLCTDRD